ncbi:TIGR03089 family protein [Rhizomonospora bruguierae]|uniref:TIGR03089 family protein n=1 Tax=Rhizomonospora bruguierae TaxID=1581705 RepID=UPI001BCA6E73|nr:TIGR03089 family protein [Micromonospora sp. NBRC 107566]
MAATIGAALAAAVAADPARPLLTFYDDGTGERTELSGATLANWVAKTANLLVDGLGLGEGDAALVDLPPHWQTAAVLLGCWSAGLTVAGEPPAEVAFATQDRAAGHAGGAGDIYGLALAPMALPMRDAPPGVLDYVLEVRAFGDHFTPMGTVGPALPDVSQAELLARAAAAGHAPGTRLLFDAAAHPDPLDWLLAPLAARASIVLCAHADPARLAKLAEVERATVVS